MSAARVLLMDWVLFAGLLAWNHLRVRRVRRREGIPEQKPAIRDPRSMHGLTLEGLSFVIAAAFSQPAHAASDAARLFSILFGIASVAVLFFALRHLGLQWRVKAVVTDDHTLVTTGPYAIVRHPIFAALLCLLLSTVLLITRPWAAALAVVIYVLGTEIRVRAEDGLLEQRFAGRFRQYKSAVAAYVPYLR